MLEFRILSQLDFPLFSSDPLTARILARKPSVRSALSETQRENRRALRAFLARKYSSEIKTERRYNAAPDKLLPIADTIRFAWPMSSSRLDAFFKSDDSTVNLVGKLENGRLVPSFEKWRKEFEHSWFGHMRFFRQFQKDFKGKNTPYENLCVEYSYHKWHGISNGLNCVLPLTFEAFWQPVDDSLYQFGFSDKERLSARKTATLRRLDLSLNYTVQGCSVQDYLKTLSRCCVQYQDEARVYGKYDSIYWGTENSAFMIKFYDKHKEQMNLCKKMTTLSEYKEFVKENEDKIKNVCRFEVTFRPRWWNTLETKNDKGQTMTLQNAKENDINKIIDLASVKWAQLQERIYSQVGMENASFSDQVSLAKLKIQIENSDHSVSAQAFMHHLAYQCLEKGWKHLPNKNSTHRKYRKILKDEFNWDVKIQSCKLQSISEEAQTKAGIKVTGVLPDQCPIMYSMATNAAIVGIAPFYDLKKAV